MQRSSYLILSTDHYLFQQLPVPIFILKGLYTLTRNSYASMIKVDALINLKTSRHFKLTQQEEHPCRIHKWQ